MENRDEEDDEEGGYNPALVFFTTFSLIASFAINVLVFANSLVNKVAGALHVSIFFNQEQGRLLYLVAGVFAAASAIGLFLQWRQNIGKHSEKGMWAFIALSVAYFSLFSISQ